jgi:hypothetical protein
MKWFERTSREERFTEWFQKHSGGLFDFETDQDRVFQDLGAALDKVERGLTFEFGTKRGDSREFRIREIFDTKAH